ncbi:MAG: nuclease [Betaproteobacteria bacterium]|nr:nuclease [Betaproteobacteria bacterium]
MPVHDGDTLTVLQGRTQVRVRLADIDAPELRQDFGTRSRQSLAELCFRKEATLHERGRDRYGRVLAAVSCEGDDANAEQVRRGMSWVYVRYAPKDSPLYAIEADARVQRRGMWAMPAPVPPWE